MEFLYYREDIPEIVNMQPSGSKAKPCQVKQVRQIIVKYKPLSVMWCNDSPSMVKIFPRLFFVVYL
jgi:hypothetical protein